MFVPAPVRTTNGETIDRYPLVLSENRVFATADAAVNHIPVAGVANTGIRSIRGRQKMGKGVISYKRYKPTSYYSFSAQFTSLAKTRSVNTYKNGPRPTEYHSVTREFGFGFFGGSGAGMGGIDQLVKRSSTNGNWMAVANRAIIANLEARARSEIIVKARRNKMSLGESIAEAPKTIRMVAETAILLYGAYHYLRQGNLQKSLEMLGVRHLRDRRGRVVQRASNWESKWLALRYGWMPLVYDIYNGVELVNKGFEDPSGTFTVQRNVKEHLPFFGHLWNLNDNPWQEVKVDHVTLCDVRYKYRLRVADKTSSYLTSLGLDNPLYVAWQLVPYSFVLDWMLPVSDWLHALSGPLSLTFVDGFRSTHIEHVSEWSGGPYGISRFDPRTIYWSGPAKAELRLVELDREAMSGFPIVSPYVRLPGLNPTRIADAITLIHERRKR